MQPAVQEAKEFTLKAIYSRSLKSAQSLADGLSGVDLYSEDSGSGKAYDDLLARSDIVAVIIAYVDVFSSIADHFRLIIQVLDEIKRERKC